MCCQCVLQSGGITLLNSAHDELREDCDNFYISDAGTDAECDKVLSKRPIDDSDPQ
jgi:hypothetical protein